MNSIPFVVMAALATAALPPASAAHCRRTHRSLAIPEDYYYASDLGEDYIPKRLPCYSRRSPQYYEAPYPLGYEAALPPSYGYPSLPHYHPQPAPAVLSKGIGGTICGPLGTTIRGQIGCGGLSGSVVTPLGASVSGSIGSVLHEPCRSCAHHDLSSVHYL